METVHSYDHNSKLQRQARFKTLQISSNKEKGVIKVNGGGIIIIISDTSISSCEAEESGQLIINTNDGRKIIFKAESKSETIKLLERLNRALAGSNCELRFELPIQQNPLCPSLETTENSQLQRKNSRADTVILFVIGMAIISIFMIIATTAGNQSSKEDPIDRPPVVEDAWEARLKREQEERNKQQEELYKQQEKENIPQQTVPTSQNKDTEIAAIMVSVSCAGNKGLIPRSQMGSMMKEMFQGKGIDSTEVYGNWDYYWGIAKEMDAVNKTYCLK